MPPCQRCLDRLLPATTILLTHVERDYQAPWRAIAPVLIGTTATIEERDYYGEGKTPVEALQDLLGGAGKTLEEAAR